MTSGNYVTYASDAVYTLYFTLSNYIPLAGVLTVLVPKEIEITGDPYAALTSAEGSNFQKVTKGFDTTSVYDVSTGKNVELFYINYLVPQQVPAGDYTITFGGVQNPRSFDPTGVF